MQTCTCARTLAAYGNWRHAYEHVYSGGQRRQPTQKCTRKCANTCLGMQVDMIDLRIDMWIDMRRGSAAAKPRRHATEVSLFRSRYAARHGRAAHTTLSSTSIRQGNNTVIPYFYISAMVTKMVWQRT